MTEERRDMTEADEQSGLTRDELLRRAALGAGALVASGTLAKTAGAALVAAPKPKRGGTFRVGVPNGKAADFIDGQTVFGDPEIARLLAGFETLATLDENAQPKLDGLAEEIASNKGGDVWTIRVRDGIEFHNGKTLTADDVAYSIRRILNPKLNLIGRDNFAPIWRIKKLDKRTVRLRLHEPDAVLLAAMALYSQSIVPVGYNPTTVGQGTLRYIGTGAYKVQSFDPGRQSVHVRNKNYWRSGEPYFDQVVIIDLSDDTARVNALLSGQVDAIVSLPLPQVPVIRARRDLKIYEAPSGDMMPLVMRVDVPPFNDARVRQAFRLIPDRPQMVRQALIGHGMVGNDIYCPGDECYQGKRFPQRTQDLAMAKSLLKQAGQEGMTINLPTAQIRAGLVEACQVFAENAKGAGITVNVELQSTDAYFTNSYLQAPLYTTVWTGKTYLQQVAGSSLSTSSYTETFWHKSPQYTRFFSLYKQALATLDRAKRCQVISQMQRIEYDAGGYIVWGFPNHLDAYSAKVGGLKIDRGPITLNQYGHGFRTIYFVA